MDKGLIDFEKALRLRKTIITIVFLGFIFLPSTLFYIATVSETHSFKNLDQETYSRRMNDSCYYAWILLFAMAVIVIPCLIIILRMINRYFKFFKRLSATDIQEMIALNNKEDFLYKYQPSYIISDDTITFFTTFYQNTIPFSEIKRIKIKQNYYRGYSANVFIDTNKNSYLYTLAGDPYKVRNFVTEALTRNPNITNNSDWNR
ncbi:hypothetical protein [Chryseobacterium sp.]|uniref:hypothetical protein n=1 Tax=Chryseobacterium sp. TaxID=1871047 RepID=UPI00388D415B